MADLSGSYARIECALGLTAPLPHTGPLPIALAAQEVAPSDSIHLETFDTAWGLINQRYWDPDFGGLDWNAVRDELRPQAARARDTEELRGVLREIRKNGWRQRWIPDAAARLGMTATKTLLPHLPRSLM